MTISVRSAKNKGARLQNHIRDRLRAVFSSLHEDDILAQPMGQSGSDIILTPAARELIKYSFEAKAFAKFSMYSHMEQASANARPDETPIVVFRADRKKAMVMVDFEHFIKLITPKDK